MARTALTPNTGVVTNPTAGALLVWTAADASAAPNGNSVALTGKELVLAWNTHATTSYTVTVATAADNVLGRTKDITTETIVAGDIHQFGVPQLNGWLQTDGTLWLNASNASIKFCILHLP